MQPTNPQKFIEKAQEAIATQERLIAQEEHMAKQKAEEKAQRLAEKLNTLRYTHANPKAAGMQEGFFYDFSNYGVHDRLGDDGLTQWHPAFLSLGKNLDECAEKYRGFCKKYKPKPKNHKTVMARYEAISDCFASLAMTTMDKHPQVARSILQKHRSGG